MPTQNIVLCPGFLASLIFQAFIFFIVNCVLLGALVVFAHLRRFILDIFD